jgi:hypothetical protein
MSQDQEITTPDQALARAREAVRGTQPAIDRYESQVSDREDHWMVRFENPTVLADGVRQHLAVQVDKATGATHVFFGR